jgi:hypothetical protein
LSCYGAIEAEVFEDSVDGVLIGEVPRDERADGECPAPLRARARARGVSVESLLILLSVAAADDDALRAPRASAFQ